MPRGAAFAAAGRAAGPKARPEAGVFRLPNAAPLGIFLCA